jgi:hypothetical protein
VNYQNQ